MTDDDLAMYGKAVADSLHNFRGPQTRSHLQEVLCTMGLTSEDADEVVTYALAHDLLTEKADGIRPTKRHP